MLAQDGRHPMSFCGGLALNDFAKWLYLTHMPGSVQAVPVIAGGGTDTAARSQRATYDWQDGSHALYAAGGASPAVINGWSLQKEMCMQQAGRFFCMQGLAVASACTACLIPIPALEMKRSRAATLYIAPKQKRISWHGGHHIGETVGVLA